MDDKGNIIELKEAQMTQPTPEQLAREILDALANEHGDETFVSSAFAYYEEAEVKIAATLRAYGDQNIEEAAQTVLALDRDSRQGGIITSDIVVGSIRALKSSSSEGQGGGA